jgi:chorismate-pyruvate lyase
MTDINSISKDSQYAGEALNFLHGLIFDILLETDGRTTDLLETLLNEKILVIVIRQEQINEENADLLGESSGAPYYIRESILISEKSHFIVSHNIALVNSKHVPPSLFEKIAHRQEGIGKSISSIGLHTFRKVVDSGLKSEEEAVDLFQKPIKLHFPELRNKVPYKRYSIYFGLVPGIQMLEYFNPDVVRHRLKQVTNYKIGGMNMSDETTKEQRRAMKQLRKEEKERVKEQKRAMKQLRKEEKDRVKEQKSLEKQTRKEEKIADSKGIE